jgi:UDP-N-acetylmuramate dehydrogenase
MNIQQNVKLAKYTSWQVGGPAAHFCLPTTLQEVQEAQNWARLHSCPITVIGEGSNVLIHDQGLEGLVIAMKNFSGFSEAGSDENWIRLTCKAGTSKSEILKFCLQKKLPAALFLAGLPGDLAGGAVMNAGVAESFVPREFVEIVDWIKVLRPDSSEAVLQNKQLSWDYRHCHGWQPGIIVEVGLKLQRLPDLQILEKVREANRQRLSKQPLDKPSCGSVFRNPPSGLKSAQLIDSCGLKGYTVGGAQVSLKHANFIVNLGTATAQEIWDVMNHVKKTVFEKTNVELKSEVVLLGPWGSSS